MGRGSVLVNARRDAIPLPVAFGVGWSRAEPRDDFGGCVLAHVAGAVVEVFADGSAPPSVNREVLAGLAVGLGVFGGFLAANYGFGVH